MVKCGGKDSSAIHNNPSCAFWLQIQWNQREIDTIPQEVWLQPQNGPLLSSCIRIHRCKSQGNKTRSVPVVRVSVRTFFLLFLLSFMMKICVCVPSESLTMLVPITLENWEGIFFSFDFKYMCIAIVIEHTFSLFPVGLHYSPIWINSHKLTVVLMDQSECQL